MLKNELIVKSVEEECGEEYWIVTFPITLTKNEAIERIKSIIPYFVAFCNKWHRKNDATAVKYKFLSVCKKCFLQDVPSVSELLP